MRVQAPLGVGKQLCLLCPFRMCEMIAIVFVAIGPRSYLWTG